jgi:EAL domain-containing protein (putative c-di-GMP-specific phosphodiesterase class I)
VVSRLHNRGLRLEARTILVLTLTLTLGWMLVIGLGFGGKSVALYVSDIGTAVAALAAACACGFAARRAERKLRRVWILVGLSAFSWGSGQVIWAWYELIQRREVPFPSLADAGFLAAVPFAVAGMLMFPREGSSAAGRVRALIDGVIIAFSALMTSWVFVLKPVFRRLGRWVLHEACGQLVAWQEQFPDCRGMTMNVNISGRHLEDASMIDDVQDALAESGLEPARLVLEMTESVLMAHTEENVELLVRLKELGVGLAIDDFGTGYSSLSYLHRFPADVIKIDRSFVERLESSQSEAELLRTIVQLGQSLRMVTVAEGVETAVQEQALREMGCELAQGFHFYRPLTPERLHQLFAPADETAVARSTRHAA